MALHYENLDKFWSKIQIVLRELVWVCDYQGCLIIGGLSMTCEGNNDQQKQCKPVFNTATGPLTIIRPSLMIT